MLGTNLLAGAASSRPPGCGGALLLLLPSCEAEAAGGAAVDRLRGPAGRPEPQEGPAGRPSGGEVNAATDPLA